MPEQKNYLIKLIANLEKFETSKENIPFKVEDIEENGFLIKTEGLFGFISFNHMPWIYSNTDAWKVVYPSIKGKVFFAQIHHFNKETISIILNGNIPQFKKVNLTSFQKYNAIVLQKTPYGVYVDVGVHFNWNCGSISGLLHKSHFNDSELYNNIQEGDSLEVYYWGTNPNEQHLFGRTKLAEEWINGEIEELLGKVVKVNVTVDENGYKHYLVNDKFKAALPCTKIIYPHYKKVVRAAIGNLANNDTIYCEVVLVNLLDKTLKLKWDLRHEIEASLKRNIADDNIQRLLTEYKNKSNAIENILHLPDLRTLKQLK